MAFSWLLELDGQDLEILVNETPTVPTAPSNQPVPPVNRERGWFAGICGPT
jgi:hypothetical protein